MLTALVEHHPAPVTREELARLSGRSNRFSNFTDHVAVLKALGSGLSPTRPAAPSPHQACSSHTASDREPAPLEPAPRIRPRGSGPRPGAP